MFKPLTALAVGLSLALSGAALAKEKIDFMFPAPVDGKLTMEMTRVIKQFNESQQDVEVRDLYRQLRHHQDQKPNRRRRPGSRPRW